MYDEILVIKLICIWVVDIAFAFFAYMKIRGKLWKSCNLLIVYTIIAVGAVLSSRIIEANMGGNLILDILGFLGAPLFLIFLWIATFEAYRKKIFPIEKEGTIKPILVFLPIIIILLIVLPLINQGTINQGTVL